MDPISFFPPVLAGLLGFAAGPLAEAVTAWATPAESSSSAEPDPPPDGAAAVLPGPDRPPAATTGAASAGLNPAAAGPPAVAGRHDTRPAAAEPTAPADRPPAETSPASAPDVAPTTATRSVSPQGAQRTPTATAPAQARGSLPAVRRAAATRRPWERRRPVVDGVRVWLDGGGATPPGPAPDRAAVPDRAAPAMHTQRLSASSDAGPRSAAPAARPGGAWPANPPTRPLPSVPTAGQAPDTPPADPAPPADLDMGMHPAAIPSRPVSRDRHHPAALADGPDNPGTPDRSTGQTETAVTTTAADLEMRPAAPEPAGPPAAGAAGDQAPPDPDPAPPEPEEKVVAAPPSDRPPRRWSHRRMADRWRMGAALGGLWFLLARQLGAEHPWAIPGFFAVAFACVVLSTTDLRTGLLPNRVTAPAFAGTVTLLGGAAIITGEPDRLARSLTAALAAGLLFLVFARFAGMGMGDVKFAPTLAAALGWLSWPDVVSGMAVAFLLAGVAAVVAMTVLGWDRKAGLPLGPWLAAGALFAILTSQG